MFYSFSFNGKESKDFELVVGYVGGNSNDSSQQVLNLTNNYIRQKNTNAFRLASSYSDQPLAFDNLSVVRYSCNDANKFSYNDDELKIIYDWLTSSKSGNIVIHLTDKRDVKMKGMFYSISEKYYNGEVIGFDLKLKTESPYVYGDDKSLSFSNKNLFSVVIPSTDYANLNYIYPVMKITVLSNTDNLIMYNTAIEGDISTMEIKKCKSGEVITIDSINEIIKSSTDSNISKRFNFNFPFFIKNGSTNANGNVTNNVHFNQNVNVSISYTPLMIGGGIFG